MDTQNKNYKNTVNLPKTDFSMKANLPVSEPERLKKWESENIYAKIRRQSKDKSKYILHDGPPYANGVIHAGHALNKILKDIIVKYKAMRGFDAHYVPGWDCHGMPIEHAIFKEMGKKKDDVNQLEFRKKAREYAGKYVKTQREEFKRLGVFGDWEKPYLTMAHEYQAKIAESFLNLCEKNFIYQGMKPVPWCFDCETALADAELEYEDKGSTAIYVALEVSRTNYNPKAESHQPNKTILDLANGKSVYVLIWTTTPWTLPANVAIAFNPQLNYAIFETGSKVFIAAESLLPTLQSKFGIAETRTLKIYSGKFFATLPNLLVVERPFGGQSVGILADYVSSTDGTGIVHIAPGHGEEDYEAGLEYKLPILSPVDEKGKFTSEFKEGEGIHVQKANQKIMDLLREKNALLFKENITHSYPHCWRCKNPIIFRATKQWFMKIDHNDLREKTKQNIEDPKKIKFFPDWGKNRIGSMVEVRPDWCLSRQRLWGVPIPIIRCHSCEKVFIAETKTNIVNSFQEYGADVWFEKDANFFFTQNKISAKCCANPKIEKEKDIIDVWFDSGVSHQAVLKSDHFDLKFPADLYLEGSDQHRGWFQSSLITSMALEEKSPFQSVLTHGFVVDGEGKKMSKSAGNVVAPQDVMKKYGADILRLWVSSCDYSQDVRLSNEILERIADAYRKIRNTIRFLLGNLTGFDPAKDQIELSKLDPVDQYILYEANNLFHEIQIGYDTFDFLKCFQNAYELCNVRLSSFYLDIVKDRLYTSAPKSEARRSAQTVIWVILKNLLRIMAPILSFTTDEAWRLLPGISNSIHEVDWPDDLEQMQNELERSGYKLEDWITIEESRESVMLALEKRRINSEIAASLDAKVILSVKEKKQFDLLKKYEHNLRFYYIVSQFTLQHDPNQAELFSAQVMRAEGEKCVRCWNYSLLVGKNAEHPALCERCTQVMKEINFN